MQFCTCISPRLSETQLSSAVCMGLWRVYVGSYGNVGLFSADETECVFLIGSVSVYHSGPWSSGVLLFAMANLMGYGIYTSSSL